METKEKKKEGLSRLFEIAGQKKGLLFLAGLLSAGSAVCMLVPYWAVYEVLKELLTHGTSPASVDEAGMIRWGWIAFCGLIGGLVLLYAALMSSHVAAFRILYGLRVRLSEHIGKLSLGYLNNTSTGAIKKTMEQNIEKIEGFIAHTIPDLVNVVATVVVMLVIFFSLDTWLTAVCLAVVLLSFALQFSNFMGKKAREFMSIYYDAQEKMSASAVQYVRGMPVVKIFGQSVRSFRQFNAEIQAYKTFALKCCDTYQNGMIAFTVLLGSMVTFILPVGILLIQGNPQSLALAAVWLFFIIMGPGVASPIYKLTFLGGNTKEIDEGVARIDRILEKKPVPEPEHPEVPQSYEVEFRHVSFSYENTEQGTRTEALRDVCFTAPQGRITALVGPSGSGKSTVANLIPRFWDVEQGEILIGGVNIKNIATTQLMDTVSFVFQDTFLFYDTLYENIAVGSPAATKETVVAAAKAAQCHEFIERLPQGYETRIGDEGVYLSGGEAQRVCVARAILKNAPILVLDEATAFADPENEYKMQQALQSLIKGKTVIIIAHRLSSIVSADNIVVLQQGRIVQQGQHDDLSVAEGLYKNMWDAYTSAYHWKFPRRNERNGRGGGQSRPVPRVHRAAAARLRDENRRRGRVSVGRRGAAGMRGPRHSEECADTGTGRSHGLRRSGERIQDAAGPSIPDKRQDRDYYRPPAVVHRLGGQHRGLAAGTDRTAGPARRLIRRRGALQEHVGCLYERLSLEVEQKLNTEI